MKNERSEIPCLLSTPESLISHPDESGEYLITDRSGFLRIGTMCVVSSPRSICPVVSVCASEDAIRDIGDAEVARILEESSLALADWLSRSGGAGR